MVINLLISDSSAVKQDACALFAGVGGMEAYESDCTFADPFTSFKGVDRFKKNVSNLGGLL